MIGATRRTPHQPPERVAALPREHEGDQPRRARRRLDDEPAAVGVRAAREVLERPRRLHRPPPHRDVLVEERPDDATGCSEWRPSPGGRCPTGPARSASAAPRPRGPPGRPDDEPARDAVDDGRLDARRAPVPRSGPAPPARRGRSAPVRATPRRGGPGSRLLRAPPAAEAAPAAVAAVDPVPPDLAASSPGQRPRAGSARPWAGRRAARGRRSRPRARRCPRRAPRHRSRRRRGGRPSGADGFGRARCTSSS